MRLSSRIQEVIKYIHNNYFEQTIDIVKKINELLTEDVICIVVDKYIEMLSMNKTDLIKKYLFSKLQLLKEIYGDVDYEY